MSRISLPMKITKTLYVENRSQWRSWLRANYKTRKEIWLIYFKKNSGKPRIPYNHSVEEALCFGWIDSTVKKIDHERFAQRFTPRNPKSRYSEPNKERLKKLLAQGKVMKSVREMLPDFHAESFRIPRDILSQLKSNRKIWKNFRQFPEHYQRIRIAFIDGARKRPEVFRQRLAYFLKMTAENKKFGMIK